MSVALDFMHNNSVTEAATSAAPALSNCTTITGINGKISGKIANTEDGRDYVIQKATMNDFADVLEFMLCDFLYTEPLNKALDVRREDAEDFFADIIRNNLADNLSYIVREKRPNGPGRVVAMRLSCILNRPARLENGLNTSTFTSKNSHKVQKIEHFLEEIESQAWHLLPADYNRLLTIAILSVSKNFTRRGIAAQLISHNLDEVRDFGCQGIITEATAFNSQQLFAKHGYQRLYEIRHADWLDTDGRQIFRCDDHTQSATLEFLTL